MICLMCKKAEPMPGLTRVTFERGEFSLVVKNVPVLICPLCGEAYTGEATAVRLLETAMESEASGMILEERDFLES